MTVGLGGAEPCWGTCETASQALALGTQGLWGREAVFCGVIPRLPWGPGVFHVGLFSCPPHSLLALTSPQVTSWALAPPSILNPLVPVPRDWCPMKDRL